MHPHSGKVHVQLILFRRNLRLYEQQYVQRKHKHGPTIIIKRTIPVIETTEEPLSASPALLAAAAAAAAAEIGFIVG